MARAKAQELSSDEEDFFQNASDAGSVAEENGEADPYENETVDEKRARLAKEYLSKLADLHRDEDDEVDEEALVTKLREEAVSTLIDYNMYYNIGQYLWPTVTSNPDPVFGIEIGICHKPFNNIYTRILKALY